MTSHTPPSSEWEGLRQRAEAIWQQTFDSVPDLIFVLDNQHRIVRANRAAAERLGASPEECVGQACYRCVHGLDAPPDYCPHSKLLADGQGHTAEVHEARLQGDFLVSTTPLVDQGGRVIGSVHVARDVTEHRQAVDLARSMAQFPQENPNPVLRAAGDGRVLYANDAAKEFLEHMGWDADGEIREPLLSAVRRVIAEGEKCEIETVCPRGRAFSFVLSPSSTEGYVNLYGRDVTERNREAEELRKANRMLRALTNSNHALLHATEEAAYLEEVCRIVVEDCGHAMVWVGFAEHDKGKTVRAAASAGFDDGYLETMKVTWADTERGRGPTGTAIRTGRVQMCRDMLSEPQFLPWRDAAVRRGYASSIALPLLDGGRAFGALTIYARKPNAFSDDEVRLLAELAADFAHGVTSLRAAEQLRRAKEAAEAADAAKSQFLTNMSHELRTPMNGVMGMMELALDEELPAEVRENLEMAKESADTLLDLLNHLLDFSRIEAGKVQLHTSAFRLRPALGRALTPLARRARHKGLALRWDIAPELPDRVVGDPRALRQVIANVVGNAIKFTGQGEVVVRVGWEGESQEQGSRRAAPLLHFAVIDTGIGISPEDRQRIFAPFTQADDSMTRPYGGTGLGLAASNRLVALMGGRMWVESVLGSGSAFHFTVQLGLAEARSDAVAAESGAAVSTESARQQAIAAVKVPSRPLRILLAEDTPANQRLMVRALSKRGHHVEVASNGQEALDLLARENFDVVLMDVQMPVLDGFEATAAIRALGDRAKSRIAIIAVTAHALAGDRQRCLAAGMDGYLSKPVHVGELIDQVERMGNGSPARD